MPEGGSKAGLEMLSPVLYLRKELLIFFFLLSLSLSEELPPDVIFLQF